jgi:hypothetical protein
MIIPKNTTDQEAAAKKSETAFEKEIDILERAIFDQPWTQFKGKSGKLVAVNIRSPFIKQYKDIIVTDAHWKRIIDDIKAAGYFVYKKLYHNSYYGYTKLYDVMITKVRLTDSQRIELHYQEDWCRPSGPGGEQFRAELA